MDEAVVRSSRLALSLTTPTKKKTKICVTDLASLMVTPFQDDRSRGQSALILMLFRLGHTSQWHKKEMKVNPPPLICACK